MGKAGRVACIFIPMALTIASFICAILLQVAGWNTLDSYYFFQANLTDLSVDGSSSNAVLSDAIGNIQTAGGIGEIYNIHLWNYCYSNETDGSDQKCSKRESQFVFDPIEIWGLESDNSTSATATTSSDNAIESAIATVKDNYDEWSEELLGSSGKKALSAYKKVAKWMFIAYQVAFWTNLATIVVGLLAICSRWGSLLTWILSVVSTFFTIASILTSTILFSVVVGALGEVLEPYGIKLTLGHNALVAGWLGAALSLGATFFWVFSICCCSGRSNPHHKSNKGGLWNAEPKGQGYNDGGFAVDRRGRGLKVEKTGGDYTRVASPYVGAPENSDQVPLHSYPYAGQQNGYEPYRHN
ncbi:hypothetical protein Slin15195_G020910 [Septoria linicola]|uniref:Integral membrane protein n=1 Tax=Septoria linicola TaxID=215465 RepID=A0A9Q9AGM2_9PEZI|nr:hypothetical protein Slin14017_G020980 [Septoria linicola]USW48772.1 hypothetical protein Slin15195_G020910 [Septoria linicola]